MYRISSALMPYKQNRSHISERNNTYRPSGWPRNVRCRSAGCPIADMLMYVVLFSVSDASQKRLRFATLLRSVANQELPVWEQRSRPLEKFVLDSGHHLIIVEFNFAELGTAIKDSDFLGRHFNAVEFFVIAVIIFLGDRYSRFLGLARALDEQAAFVVEKQADIGEIFVGNLDNGGILSVDFGAGQRLELKLVFEERRQVHEPPHI